VKSSKNTQAGFVDLDQNHKIESFNPAVEKFGWSALSALSDSLWNVLFNLINNDETELSFP